MNDLIHRLTPWAVTLFWYLVAGPQLRKLVMAHVRRPRPDVPRAIRTGAAILCITGGVVMVAGPITGAMFGDLGLFWQSVWICVAANKEDLLSPALRGTVIAVGVVCLLIGLAFTALAVWLVNSHITKGTAFATTDWLLLGVFALLAVGFFGSGFGLCQKDDGKRVLIGNGLLLSFAVFLVLASAGGLVSSFFSPHANPYMYVRLFIGSLTFAGAAFFLARKRKAANPH